MTDRAGSCRNQYIGTAPDVHEFAQISARLTAAERNYFRKLITALREQARRVG